MIRALGLAGLVLGGVGFLYGRAAARAERLPSPPASAATPAPRAPAPGATSPHRAARGVARPELAPGTVLAPVSTDPRPGETTSDTRRRVEALADLERFRVEARLTPEQEAAILRIVYDVQIELAIADAESWRVLSEEHAKAFNQFDDDVIATLQADLDARVRALLTDEQAEIFGGDGRVIDVARIQIIAGGLVAARAD